jgi:hypothetical protein
MAYRSTPRGTRPVRTVIKAAGIDVLGLLKDRWSLRHSSVSRASHNSTPLPNNQAAKSRRGIAALDLYFNEIKSITCQVAPGE